MKLEDIGEFGLIRRVKPLCFVRKENIIKGIGDDCAVYEFNREKAALFTTDMLVENVHFLRNKITPYDLGYKTMAVNLSDIASMGGRPSDAFLSIALPGDITIEYLDDLYEGMMFLGMKYGVNILGGDTTGSKKDLVLNIALTGYMDKDKVLYRSGAQPGDKIYVNGYLGESAAGLDILLNETDLNYKLKSHLIKCHNMPDVYVEEGIFLSESGAVTACIDVSDGISSDLLHICEESNCGADLYEDKLPVSTELRRYAEKMGKDPVKTVVTGGEDYKLLFTVRKETAEQLEESYMKRFGNRIYNVGEIIDGSDIFLVNREGEKLVNKPSGWNHFTR